MDEVLLRPVAGSQHVCVADNLYGLSIMYTHISDYRSQCFQKDKSMLIASEISPEII